MKQAQNKPHKPQKNGGNDRKRCDLRPLLDGQKAAETLLLARMKNEKLTESVQAVSRLFSQNCNVHPAAFDYWQARIELHLYHKETQENALALVTVEMISNLIVKSLTGARDKKQSKGGAPNAGGLAVAAGQSWREVLACLLAQTAQAKKGKRQSIKISETDRAEISAIVGNVLASRNSFNREISRLDIGECFREVESANGLNLNRKWKALDDSAPTLAELAAPIYHNPEAEANRQGAMRALLENYQECIECAFLADTGKKRKATKKSMLKLLAQVATKTQTGNGLSKKEERAQRANLTIYLMRGAQLMQADAAKKSPWQSDLIGALCAWQDSNVK